MATFETVCATLYQSNTENKYESSRCTHATKWNRCVKLQRFLQLSLGMQLNQETRASPARRLTADNLYKQLSNFKNLKTLGILTE